MWLCSQAAGRHDGVHESPAAGPTAVRAAPATAAALAEPVSTAAASGALPTPMPGPAPAARRRQRKQLHPMMSSIGVDWYPAIIAAAPEVDATQEAAKAAGTAAKRKARTSKRPRTCKKIRTGGEGLF